MWNLRNAGRELAPVVRAFPAHPVRVLRALPDEWRQRLGRTSAAEADFDADWNEHLHGLLGAPWPCPEARRLRDLLTEVGSLLSDKGVGRNDRGHLWSIDIANPLNRQVHGQEGIAVTESCRLRWTYVEGESSRRMPPLVKDVGKVEVFIHDSLHTFNNTLFEMEQAASAMPPGGVMLVDDVRSHDGFATFAKRHPEYKTILVSTLDGIGAVGIAVHALGRARVRP